MITPVLATRGRTIRSWLPNPLGGRNLKSSYLLPPSSSSRTPGGARSIRFWGDFSEILGSTRQFHGFFSISAWNKSKQMSKLFKAKRVNKVNIRATPLMVGHSRKALCSKPEYHMLFEIGWFLYLLVKVFTELRKEILDLDLGFWNCYWKRPWPFWMYCWGK